MILRYICHFQLFIINWMDLRRSHSPIMYFLNFKFYNAYILNSIYKFLVMNVFLIFLVTILKSEPLTLPIEN